MIKKVMSFVFAAVLVLTMFCASAPVVFAEEPGSEVSFTDVPEGKWYSEAVKLCYEKGFMNGTGNNKFSPDGSFTRGMFVQVLSKIDGVNLEPYAGSSFSDVNAKDWYAKATMWAHMTGYASGTGNNKFSPKSGVTRETLAQFLFNYSRRLGFDVSMRANLSSYKDASKISAWAKDAVSWAVACGLIQGTSATTLSPKNTASRAQVALIIMKYYNEIFKNGSFLTRNGMRAEVFAYIDHMPSEGDKLFSGGAYFRLFKPAGSTVSFNDLSLNIKIIKPGIEFSFDIPYEENDHTVGDEVYTEFSRTVEINLGVAPFTIGEILHVVVTVSIGAESTVLTYDVPVQSELFIK